MLKTRKQDMECTCTLTEAGSKASGGTDSRMVWDIWWIRVEKAKGRDSGLRGNILNGLTDFGIGCCIHNDECLVSI